MSASSPSFTLADGADAHVSPDGHVYSAVSSVSYEEPDGNGGTITVDTAHADQHGRHRHAVLAFKKSRQYRRVLRKLRAPARRRAGGQARRRGAGRPRTQAARSSARSGDSGDDDPAPPSRLTGRAAWAWFHAGGWSR